MKIWCILEWREKTEDFLIARKAIKIIGNHMSALWVQRIFGTHGVMAFS